MSTNERENLAAAVAVWIAVFFGSVVFITGVASVLTPEVRAEGSLMMGSEEIRFLTLMNQLRVRLGLPEVQIHSALQNAARRHSDWMASKDFLTHYGPVENKTPFQRMKEEGYERYYQAGENVACGNGDALKTFRQFIFSPPHLKNILNPHFRDVGIARGGSGREHCALYWTNEFGSRTDPKLDGPDLTDLGRITDAVIAVAGAIPPGKSVRLPAGDHPSPASTPAPRPARNRTYLQCTVPYSLGQGILTQYENADTMVEATTTDGSTVFKMTYFRNGSVLPYSPAYLNDVVSIRNLDQDLYVLIGTSGVQSGGFVIQYNSVNGAAQIDSLDGDFGSTPIACSMKTLVE